MTTIVGTSSSKSIKSDFSNYIKRSLSVSSFESIHAHHDNIQDNLSEKIDQLKKIKFSIKKNGQRQVNQRHSLKGCDLYRLVIHSEMFGTNFQRICNTVVDIGIRLALLVIFCKMETTRPFRRIIHVEEMWLYKNPRTNDYVSGFTLLTSVTLGPFIITLLYLLVTKDVEDFKAATWTWTLSLVLNGVITSLLKIIVGRPRPDFFFRCFPDGILQLPTESSTLSHLNCTGNEDDINEGYKSFPSGHSSFAFAAYGFITFYIGSKLHAFNRQGHGQSWRFCISTIPLILAIVVAVSRTCDYHHHWQDVVVGSIIGLTISYTTYRQYYPSIFSINCHRAFRKKTAETVTRHLYRYRQLSTGDIPSDNISGTKDDSLEYSKKHMKTEQKTEKWF